MHRLAAVALALLSAVPVLAQTCSGTYDDLHSNDRLGILGDEELCWIPGDATATYYVIGIMHWIDDGEGSYEVTECASTTATRYRLPPDSSCYSDGLVVKACRPPTPEEPPGVDICSDYNIMELVEILPYACLRNNWCHEDNPDARLNHCDSCEYPCFPGALLRLTLRYPSCS